ATSATSMRSRPPVERMTHARMLPRSSDTRTGASRSESDSDLGCFTRRLPSGAGRGAKRVPPPSVGPARTARGGTGGAGHTIDARVHLHEPQAGASASGARASVDVVRSRHTTRQMGYAD